MITIVLLFNRCFFFQTKEPWIVFKEKPTEKSGPGYVERRQKVSSAIISVCSIPETTQIVSTQNRHNLGDNTVHHHQVSA